MLTHLDSWQATADTTATRTNRLRADNIADTAQNFTDAHCVPFHVHHCHLQVAISSTCRTSGQILTGRSHR